MHRVGILVKKDKIRLVDSKGQKAKTPALLGSNLIRIAVNEFCETFGEDCLRLLHGLFKSICRSGANPEKVLRIRGGAMQVYHHNQ